MRAPYTQLYVHLVWSTWDRLPLLTIHIRPAVYVCIQAECEKINAQLVAIGGTEDHVHLLARIPVTLPIATFAKQVKGSSSHMVNNCLQNAEPFKWQGGYGAFTVSKSLLPSIQSYILNQEQHHLEQTTDKDLEIAWVEKPNIDNDS